METEIISVAQAHDLVPLFDREYFVGALLDAHEGHVDPAGVTHAYVKAARAAGAAVRRNCWARAIARAADGTWNVSLHDTSTGAELGIVNCEHVVNCGGLWAREVGRMVGLELPLLAMEHTYLVTGADRRGDRVQPAQRSRIAPSHRLRRRDLHAPGRLRLVAGQL